MNAITKHLTKLKANSFSSVFQQAILKASFLFAEENMEENKSDEKQMETDLSAKATLTITNAKAYKLPLAKLTVSGSVGEEDDEHKVVQRAIIFVIDRSYSMV